MKNKALKFILLLGAVALITWILTRWVKPNSDRHATAQSETHTVQTVPTLTNETNALTAQSNAQLAPTSPGAVALRSPSQTIDDRGKPEAFQQSVEDKNSPIEFYGKVVDQNGAPISGVKVNASARQWYVRAPGTFDAGAHFIPIERETRADGRFDIRGMRADGFDLKSIAKEGYDSSPKTTHSFGPNSGGFENPVLFKMWKRGASAQLISQDIDTRIPYDATPVVFDLLTGQQVAESSTAGDLRVSLVRNPLNLSSSYSRAFEWHATIEALNGGLVRSDDDFMNVAPESGYQPRIQIDMPADATNWVNIYDISFLPARGGNVYSRVKLEFRVDSAKPQTGFTITSAANSSGSRNLQP